MFYKEDEIERNLICLRCRQRYIDPRIIQPCGETLCLACIQAVQTDTGDEIDCFFCNTRHPIPSDGFKPNRLIDNLLNANKVFRRNSSVEALKEKLSRIAKFTTELKAQMDEITPEIIFKHCDEIRLHIDDTVDAKKRDLDDIRDDLFMQVKSYERECEDNLKVVKAHLDATMSEIDEFLKGVKLTDENLINDQSDQAEGYLNKIEALLKNSELENTQFSGRLVKFKPNVESLVRADVGNFDIEKLKIPNELNSLLSDKISPLMSDFQGELVLTLKGHSHTVGCLLALNTDILLSGSFDKTIKVWNIDTAECLRTIEVDHDVVSLVRLSDSSIAAGSLGNSIDIWDVNTGKLLRSLKGHTDWVYSLIVLPESGYLLSGSADRSIRLWDVTTGEGGELVRTIAGAHDSDVLSLLFLGDDRIVSASDDKRVKMWNLGSGEMVRVFNGHTAAIWCLVLLADDDNGEERFASGSHDRTIRIWNVSSGETVRVLSGHTDEIFELSVFSDGSLVSVSADRTIRVWNGETGELVKTKQAHVDKIFSLECMTEYNYIITGSFDCSIKIWK